MPRELSRGSARAPGAAVWLTPREATLLWAAVSGDLHLHNPTEDELDALDRKLEAVPDEE